MPTHFEAASAETERAELERVAEAIGRSSRLASLLNYIGARYFEGKIDQLSEYAIATEVFGRSRSTFDAGEDAIARVEAHRLRKRLKEYYEGPGKDHPIQISLPPGTYIPQFVRKPSEPTPGTSSATPESVLANVSPMVGQPPHKPPAALIAESTPARRRPRFRLYALLAVAFAGAVVSAVFLNPHSHPTTAITGAGAGSTTQSAPLIPASASVRILAGFTGDPQTDSTGAVWGPDRYVRGGGAWRRADGFIARTSDTFLFQNWRRGDTFYDIPLRPGVYELRLYFVATESESQDMPTFTVKINDKLALQGFDIDSDALGPNIADERVFRDVSPASDGKLHLAFTSERGTPQLNAIEIVPGLPHKQLPIRLLMQRTSYTDHDGHVWHPDNYYMDGRLSDHHQQIIGASDPDLFSTERYGHFTYAIPVDTRDRYTLILHFVEFYFGPNAPGGGGVGSRLFKVMCNGQTLLDNFDIYKEAGSLHVLTRAFYHLKPSPQGKLNLTFEPIANNATVSGIEVLDENK